MAVHGVGTHKRVGVAETLGVGGLNLPMEKDKHRANLYSQRVQQAINKKQIKRSMRKRKRSRAGPRLTRAARLAWESQKAALLKVATYNVRSLSVKGVNGYGRDEVVLHEAAAKNVAVVGIRETRRPGRAVSTAAGFRVFYSGSVQGGQQGVALAAKESIYKMMRYDSITVSSTWKLTSVSMRYSQGDGVNTSLSRLMYCTHV